MPIEAETPAAADLRALDDIAIAMQSGAGLPEIVRTAARTLGASLILTDRSGATLAVAARSPADEASMQSDGAGIETVELRMADEVVGVLRVRPRPDTVAPSDTLLRLVTTLLASEVQRVRAPERVAGEAAAAFLRAIARRELETREAVLEAAGELGLDLGAGASMIAIRARTRVMVEVDSRERLATVALRGARAVSPLALAGAAEHADATAGELVVLLPGGDEALVRRASESVLAELQASLPTHTFTIGFSRVADAADLARAGAEALLACNVAEGDPEAPLLGFDETGAYRLLLSAMSENPSELQRFYAETVEPLVAYDEQYETDLVHTLEAFLDNDGSVAGTAQRLYTHRHTVRYRLERVRELSGLDVGSSDGREKLSLGLKAMRVLGIVARETPAGEGGSSGGRVSRG